MAAAAEDSTHATANERCTVESDQEAQKKPICLIVLGMAGSGKTTFVQVNSQDCYTSSHKLHYRSKHD